ncbi:RodZ domain-containing protein [Actinacidiphila glaucinigra]|uniref:helix-turn-helix domain-containing protein n=1 Tax=Actinacidiphila glaucinigra TaxID=235986 RepID=UPI00339E0D7E
MSIGNPPPDDRIPVGRALAQARVAAGLTVDEVSTTTRVRAPIVHAIEQDDFSRCGGDVYARGHIRAIARAVGLDPEALIEQFSAEHGSAPAPTPVAPLYEAERMRSEPRRPNWTAAMVAAIVAVVGFVGFTLFSGGEDGGKEPVAGKPSAASPAAKPSGNPTSTAPRPEESDSAIAAAPADKVTVKLTAPNAKSWIQAVDSNGRQLFQGSLEPGDSKTFTDKSKINLIIGNAGAVNLFVNGKDLGPAGDPGQVQRLTFTPGDPEAG